MPQTVFPLRTLRTYLLQPAILAATAIAVVGCEAGERSLIDITVIANRTAQRSVQVTVTGMVGTWPVSVSYPQVPQPLEFPVHVKLRLAETVGGGYSLSVTGLDEQQRPVAWAKIEGEHAPGGLTMAEVVLGYARGDGSLDTRPDVRRGDVAVMPDASRPDGRAVDGPRQSDGGRPDAAAPACDPPCLAPLSCNQQVSPPRCDCGGELCQAPLSCNGEAGPNARCDCGGELCAPPLSCNGQVQPRPRCDCGGVTCVVGQECKDGKCQCLADGASCSEGAACCGKLCCDGQCAAECCMSEGASCATGGKPCCGGLACCDGLCAASCCARSGERCESSANCCGGSCQDGRCCAARGEACDAGKPCCAGATCQNGSCATPIPPPPICRRRGEQCGAEAGCCTGLSCCGGVCASAVGQSCAEQADCCDGACHPQKQVCCAIFGQACGADGDCCEGTCFPGLGVCIPACLDNGAQCGSKGAGMACCSGICGHINHREMRQCCTPSSIGDACDQDRPCCTERYGVLDCGADGTCCVDDWDECRTAADCCTKMDRMCESGHCCVPVHTACDPNVETPCCRGYCALPQGESQHQCCVRDGYWGCEQDSDCCGEQTATRCSEDGACCRPAGAECVGGQYYCCSDRCQDVGGTERCCSPASGPCGADEDCCDGNRCQAGQCVLP